MDMTQTGARRSKSWTAEQRQEFGARLKWALKRSGYKYTATAVAEVQQRRSDLAPRTFFAHVSGTRVPDDDGLVEIYARLFGVSVDFLLLKEDYPKGVAINHASVNQVLEPSQQNSSQIMEPRYISILTASDIRDLLTGARKLRAKSRERLPVPHHVAAGPNVISYRMPSFDHSMVGPGSDSFPPGTDMIFDPDRAIAPGEYLLCLPADSDEPTLRRLQSSFAYLPSAPRYPFKLVAINPDTAPLVVEAAEDCAIVGRLIHTMRNW